LEGNRDIAIEWLGHELFSGDHSFSDQIIFKRILIPYLEFDAGFIVKRECEGMVPFRSFACVYAIIGTECLGANSDFDIWIHFAVEWYTLLFQCCE